MIAITWTFAWWVLPVALLVVGSVIILIWLDRQGGSSIMDLSPLLGCGMWLILCVVALALALWLKP